MILKVNKKDLFEKWLEWLNPILPLKVADRRVLAAYITLHFLHKDQYSPKALNELLFSEATKKIVAKRLKMTVPQIEKSLSYFKDKGLIVDGAFRSSLTNYPRNNKFRILIDFEITD